MSWKPSRGFVSVLSPATTLLSALLPSSTLQRPLPSIVQMKQSQPRIPPRLRGTAYRMTVLILSCHASVALSGQLGRIPSAPTSISVVSQAFTRAPLAPNLRGILLAAKVLWQWKAGNSTLQPVGTCVGYAQWPVGIHAQFTQRVMNLCYTMYEAGPAGKRLPVLEQGNSYATSQGMAKMPC